MTLANANAMRDHITLTLGDFTKSNDLIDGCLDTRLTQDVVDEIVRLSAEDRSKVLTARCTRIEGLVFRACDNWRIRGEFSFSRKVNFFNPMLEQYDLSSESGSPDWVFRDGVEIDVGLCTYAVRDSWRMATESAMSMNRLIRDISRKSDVVYGWTGRAGARLDEKRRIASEALERFYEAASPIKKATSIDSSVSPAGFCPTLAPPPLAAYSPIYRVEESYKGMSGIYFIERQGSLVYIGKSVSLGERWRSHHKATRTDRVAVIPMEPQYLTLAEQNMIHRFMPMLNKEWEFEYAHGALVGYAPMLASEDGYPSLSRIVSKEKKRKGKDASCQSAL